MGEAQQDAVITVMETPIQVNVQDNTLIAEHSLLETAVEEANYDAVVTLT
jgi:hypothetical protein